MARAKSKAKETEDERASATPPAPLAPDRPAIDLTPAEWRRAPWRELPPLPLEPPRPFDPAALIPRASVYGDKGQGWEWQGVPREVPVFLSREEAHFWFVAINKPMGTTKVRAQRLATTAYGGELTKQDVLDELALSGWGGPDIVGPLFALLPFDDAVDIALHDPLATPGSFANYLQPGILGLLGRVPWFTEAERAALRERCRGKVKPPPSSRYQAGPPELYLAAALGGLEDEVLKVVESWPDGHYAGEDWHDHYHAPQRVVFGLATPDLVKHHVRRLGLTCRTVEHARTWLAHTELSALDWLREGLQAEGNREKAEALFQGFAVVHAPEAAPHMLELRRASKASRQAGEWLKAEADRAIPGLLATAAGRGALAEAALEHLRQEKRLGREALVRAAVEAAPPEVGARLRALVLDREERVYPVLEAAPAWLELAPPLPAKKALPWAAPAELPPVVVEGRRLSDALVERLLATLRQAPLDVPHPGLRALREKGDRPALAAFAWALFDRWLTDGGPSKEKWALLALGHLGDDAVALRLTPLVRAWPGESQHARAVLGLEVLRAIGTDVALMQLNAIAQKLKFKALKERARALMDAIATERKLTRLELEDRIVPDCDLDERGRRTFDFGPRAFEFVLGPDLRPQLRDASGKLLADLPKPGARDDAEKAGRAVAEWKLLKKQIKEVAKLQAERLELAMVRGRRWSREDFEALLVRHPLMTHLVRLLVLGVYDPGGRLVRTFRVTEDATYADEQDAATTLEGARRIGIVHPLDLPGEARAAWGQVFADYELVSPFPQLDRPTFTLGPEEAQGRDLAGRLGGRKVPAGALVSALERLGWDRGRPQDGGVFFGHTKPFYGANVTAVIQYEGVPVSAGSLADWEDQAIEGAYFVGGDPGLLGYDDELRGKELLLSRVDPIAVSEVLRDLAALAEKAR